MFEEQLSEEQLQKKIDALKAELEPLEKLQRENYIKKEDEVQLKLKRCKSKQDKFELEDLVFAAFSRCNCGAGLAYPKHIGIHGYWMCSDILLGRAIPHGQEGSKEHSGEFPFAFYEIKSDTQPSAQGNTTRPKE